MALPQASPGALVPVTRGGGLVPALGPGTLLASGRYRLIQRWGEAAAPSLGNEPPLMLAADIEAAGERVLIQEVMLTEYGPEQAEELRHQIATTFERLGQLGAAAPLIGHFAERGRHFLLFELPAGDVLLDRLKRAPGPLDEVTAITYILRALDALEQMERQIPPVVHGNICPANIILRPSGQVALLGHSLSLLLFPGARQQEQAAGVAGYAAPEQSRGQATSRSDLFALCAILHQAVTGAAPQPRAGALYAPARRLNPAVSLELEDVLSKGLRPAPNQRFQSVAELRSALLPLASGQRLTHPEEDMPAEAQPVTPALVPVRDARGRLVLPRRKTAQQPLFVLASTLLLIVIVGAGLLVAVLPRQTASTKPTPTPSDLSTLFQSKGIALSGGAFIFDTQQEDNAQKQQAAVALTGGDLRGALADFRTALSSDPTDAEAAIYAQDVQIQLEGDPYITIVVAASFGTNSDITAARSELQGVYIAQASANELATLPGATHVRVLILNSGQNPDDVGTAVTELLRERKAGNARHLVGVIGWPQSAQMRNAIPSLASSGLPLLSPVADDDGLAAGATNVFSLVPSTSEQAAILANAAVTQMGARRIAVFFDQAGASSKAVVANFTQAASAYSSQGVAVIPQGYADATPDFASAVAGAAAQGADLIYFSGDDAHAVELAQALNTYNSRNGTHLHALVNTAAFTPALLGVGTSSTATNARIHAQALPWLYVAGLADVSSWSSAGTEQNDTSPSFFSSFAAQFGQAGTVSGLPVPDATAILFHDAADLLITATGRAMSVAHGVITYATPAAVRSRLLRFDSSHPYVGAGGAIGFAANGSVPQKALPVFELAVVSGASADSVAAHPELLLIAGGRQLFCGGSTCRPTS